MSSCFRCGAQVAPEDRFCGNCGAPLAEAGRGESVAAAAAGAGVVAAAHSAGEPQEDETTLDGDAPRESSNLDAAPAEPFNLEETIIDPPPGSPRPVEPIRDDALGAGTGATGDATADAAADQNQNQNQNSNQNAAGEVPPMSDAPAPSRETGEAQPPPAVPFVEGGRLERHGEEFDGGGRTGGPRRGTTGGGGSSRHATKQLDPGTVLNSRYEIVRRVGGGGMGAVYYAKDRNLGDAPRAVKEMIQANLDPAQHEKAVEDFRRESMLLASLEHPSIPTIYDYFFDDAAARFYLVMKYISGGDILARLRNAQAGRIDEGTVTDWAAQVADVLDYLHNRRPPIIYRDLKPANLMIDGNSGRVMLIDFGIARWVAPQEKGVTAVGTMGYAPPELFSGKVEPRSDIYSLGATMFHLLTGSDPQDNPLLIFDFAKHPRPRQINPTISNEMERILMRTVEYKPEGRFRSAAELREALLAHLERLRAGAASYGGVSPERPSERTVAVEMVYCGFCGGRIAVDDLYCAHCGQKQPLAEASSALRAARATAKLVVSGTTELEASFPLPKDSNLVGRMDPNSNIFPEVDLSKFDPETKISRRHARIWREGDTFLVEDLGSVNGTVINESIRLGPRQPRALENGDKIRLGETTLHFLIG